MGGGRGDLIGAAGPAGVRGAGFSGGSGDFYRDRPGPNRGGAAGGMGCNGDDYLGRSSGAQNGLGRPSGPGGAGVGKPGDSQSSFATDPIFF